MNKITIFTPTFNRMEKLKILYESLIRQKNKKFEWLVIDDGSTDDTKSLINSFISEDIISIRYYYKKNGGKHTAYNYAIEKCETDFFVCVDSDDFLQKNDIDTIYKNIDLLKSKNIGLIFPRKNSVNKVEKLKEFSNKEIDVMDLKFLTNENIETTIVLRTNAIKNDKFPEFKGEKFLSEEILYNSLTSKGKFLYINDYVVDAEYLTEGLTKNIYKYYKQNFNSSILLQKSRYEFVGKYSIVIKYINKIKCIININALCITNKKNVFLYTPSIQLSIILWPVSYIWSLVKYGK